MEIWITVEAIRDRLSMGRTQKRCGLMELPTECSADVESPNRKGNQEWCTVVEGHYGPDFQGSGVVERTGACEKELW